MEAPVMAIETQARGKIDIGISENSRQAVGRILNTLLANEFVLYTQSRNYHWNVVGPQFGQFHKLFEEQYEALNEIVDEAAERARQLHVNAKGTLQEFLEQASVRQEPGVYPGAMEMVFNLMDGHEIIIRSLRESADACADQYHDMGTNDFLIGLMEKHEKMAWMLRAHLEESHS
jgi:starvation-inducible DNA-binding protein